jgi:membrane protease YdiL (CAAX protease family)
MKIPPVSIVAAIAAVLFWTAKAVAIGAFGRDSYDDPIASALFLVGLLSFVIAVVTIVWRTLRGRHIGLRVLACLGALVVTSGFSAATTPVFESLIDSWVGAELNLWILAIALLVVVARGSVDHRAAEAGAA